MKAFKKFENKKVASIAAKNIKGGDLVTYLPMLRTNDPTRDPLKK